MRAAVADLMAAVGCKADRGTNIAHLLLPRALPPREIAGAALRAARAWRGADRSVLLLWSSARTPARRWLRGR
jgi:hypothetical protein